MLIGYCCESQEERHHWEDEDVGGWAISKWNPSDMRWDGVKWIYMAQDRDQWRTLMNMVLNLRVP
jgi:hypothetical protein